MKEEQQPPRATPLQVIKTVFWSFFGIRRRSEHDKVAPALTLGQVVVAGIIGAVIFVLCLVALVRFITR